MIENPSGAGAGTVDVSAVAAAFRPPYPNVLLIGSDDEVRALLSAWQPVVGRPMTRGDSIDAIRAVSEGTVVIWHVDRLSRAEQDELAQLVAERGGIHVVSIAAAAVYPDVQRGCFSDALYCRLNTLVIDLARCRAPA